MILNNYLKMRRHGLYCSAGGFYIDPTAPVPRALITHGHSDHAVPGHKQVLATEETIKIMQVRYPDTSTQYQTIKLQTTLAIGDVTVKFLPAGHILGSAQILMHFKDQKTILISGDYKRQPDSTCLAYEPHPCDIFITESTFGLPIFKHPDISVELQKLLKSLRTFPECPHLIGAYGLGKCQRLIVTLRGLGYDKAIYLHGSLFKLCALYERFGITLGEVKNATTENPKNLQGQVIFCPPSALHDRWSRRLAGAIKCFASGFMQTRARAQQKGIVLPLIVSDHADWNELLQTVKDNNPQEVYVTHGSGQTLVYALNQMNYQAMPLNLMKQFEED